MRVESYLVGVGVRLFRGGFVGKEMRGFLLYFSIVRGTRTLAKDVINGPSLDSSLSLSLSLSVPLSIHASVNENNSDRNPHISTLFTGYTNFFSLPVSICSYPYYIDMEQGNVHITFHIKYWHRIE